MDDVLEQLGTWHAQGRDVAMATVVRTSGSTPRREGAKLIVNEEGQLAGSVSGGCVETDVSLHALEALKAGQPRLVSYGISDEMGISVGLACGGQIEVLIEGQPAPARKAATTEAFQEVSDLARQEIPVVVATILKPDDRLGQRAIHARGERRGSLGDPELDRAVSEHAPRFMRQAQSGTVKTQDSSGNEVEIFFDAYPAPPTLFIFGGVHVGIPLMKFAKILNFRVNVVDPRGVFATRERFAEADELVIEHPEDYVRSHEYNENSYVVVLTHDPKLDEPVLMEVMRQRPTYIGAIGSRKTNEERTARLAAAGATPEMLARVHSPIGLDIGSQAPEEIALAIIAEIIATRYGKTGSTLKNLVAAAR
jgi:xanthine dehydrogenase accessory factor